MFDTTVPPASAWVDDDGKQHIEPTADRYCAEPRPLAVIYVLMPREPARREVTIEGLAPAAALNALMKQRFCSTPLDVTYTTVSLAALAGLVQETPVRQLYRPEGLETLASVVAAVRENIDHDGR